MRDIIDGRQTFSQRDIPEEEEEEEDEEDELDRVEMHDNACQTDVQEDGLKVEMQKEVIEKLQSQLEQKDALIKDLRTRLAHMQSQISFIMDQSNRQHSDAVSGSASSNIQTR
eukprot:TRINITY_DN4408_c0_g1_i16.p4 TRINITY_DN4408_c0_g1~~TRINITY_DN4408_c0_g1_i16.p4  ORF type:complete len:113 (+),score=26.44 TRINITY_DN4408_c0_g1_i16:175-513(+)